MSESVDNDIAYRITKKNHGYCVTGQQSGFMVNYTISDLSELVEVIEKIKTDYHQYQNNQPD